MPDTDRDSLSEHSEESDSPIEEELEEVEEGGDEEVEEEEEEEIGEEEKGEEEEEEDEDEGEDEDEDDEVLEEEEEEEEEEDEEDDEEEEARDEEEINDAGKKIESERHVEDQILVSSTIRKSESNLATPSKDATVDSFVAHDSLVKIRAANVKVASDASVVDVQPAVQDISSKEKVCSKSQCDEREMVVSLKRKTLGEEDPGRIKNFYIQTHGNGESHLNSGASISSENTSPLQVHTKGLAETNIAKGDTLIGKSNGILEKEVLHLDPHGELKIHEDPSLSRMHTPKRRPRSSSPSGTPENLSKKPAIVCSYYARGWCIKGSSCRFRHQKEGSEEDLAESSRKEDVLGGAGSRGEAERLGISSSQERPDISISENSSKSLLQMQRSLVRAYGGESHGPAHFHDGEEFCKIDTPQVGHTLIQDEYKSPLGVSSGSDCMDASQSSKEHSLSRKYLHEEQLQQELPNREFLNDSPFPRGSSLTRSSIVPEDGYYSGSSSMPSSLFKNNNLFSHGRRTEDVAFLDQSRYPLHGSHSSYSLSRSLNTAFNSPYQPAPGLSFTSEHLEIHKTCDFGKESHGSGSASLQRSSPYFSRHDVENGLLRSVQRDLPAPFRHRMETQENSWEPSIPFRPSFHYAPPSFSSPGSQYDPLLDSIEPRNTGDVALQASERAINIHISDHSTKCDTLLLYRSQIPEHRVDRPLRSFPHSQEGVLTRSKPADGLCTKPSLAATAGHTVTDGGNSSAYKEDPDHIAESPNVNGAEHGGILRNQGDKSKTTIESKSMKIFRAALVNFVKELVKPSWREGHLSKDAHKKVVKKAVEKVLSALQTHQVPNTTESINQYLSTSRPKILKLVESYVEKYSKN